MTVNLHRPLHGCRGGPLPDLVVGKGGPLPAPCSPLRGWVEGQGICSPLWGRVEGWWRQHSRCQTGSRDTPHLRLVDTDDIDDINDQGSAESGSACVTLCITVSYSSRPDWRHDDHKIDITDSKFQIDDFTLQIGDFTLQIGDSTLQIGDLKPRIVDLTLSRTSSKRRIDVTKRWIVDLNDLPPFRTLKSAIRNFKSTISSFKSAIRNVPQRHVSVKSPPRGFIEAIQRSNHSTRSSKKGR